MAISPLLNPSALRRVVESVPEPTSAQRVAAGAWANTVRQDFFHRENEKPHQGAFLSEIFGTVLGYSQLTSADTHGVFHLKAEAASNETAGGKTPDAQLGFFSTSESLTRAVVELKAPGADLDARQHRAGRQTAVEQGFSYVSKFDGCRWVIVSNFVTIRLYWTVRGEAYCWDSDVADLDQPERLAELIAVLHRDNLLSRADTSPTAALADTSRRDEKAVTEEFYRFFKTTRAALFDGLTVSDPDAVGASPETHQRRILNHTQKILDRLLFVCFAEDTELLPANVLNTALNQAGTGFVATSRWDQLKGLFAAIDKGLPEQSITAYNGGLFAPDPPLDALQLVDDDLEFVAEMSSYDFSSQLGVEVLGRVFERSIADIEALHASIGPQADEPRAAAKARSKRAQDGVFYTPEWVTRFVAEETVGRG